MSYNPFIKGEFPVGVRTIELVGSSNNYTTEIWYPAADKYRGVEALDTFKFVDELPEATQEAVRDAEGIEGKRPLVMYWHGGYGHRREMAAMCVLLSTHGFIVAAPDFPGDHITKMYGSDPEIATKPVDASAEARPGQAAEIIELLLASGDDFLSSVLDGENVGSFGLSLGGFTTLAANSSSRRLKASFAIAPACGFRSPLPQIARIAKFYRLDEWKSSASTFLLTGEADALVIVDDVREMFARLPEPKKLAVLREGGHLHWADNAELMHETLRLRYLSGEFPDPELDGQKLGNAFRPFSELCPAKHALDVMRSTIVAHFEANLKDSDEARKFLDDDLAGTFAARGIDLELDNERKQTAGA